VHVDSLSLGAAAPGVHFEIIGKDAEKLKS
jgi:hypothetical protein